MKDTALALGARVEHVFAVVKRLSETPRRCWSNSHWMQALKPAWPATASRRKHTAHAHSSGAWPWRGSPRFQCN